MTATAHPPHAATASGATVAAYHRLLWRFAGRVPDELVSEARQWLAEGLVVEIAQAVVFAALAGRLPVTATDAGLLADTLTDAGQDADVLADLEISEVDPPTPYGIAPVSPELLATLGDAAPRCLDLTGGYQGPGAADAVDAAAVAALTADRVRAEPLALWRAWRYPGFSAQWPPPKRLFLVQVRTRPVSLAAELQAALAAAGESEPQVEVFTDPDDLPAYQRTALDFAALLWTAAPAEPVRVAPTFPAADRLPDLAMLLGEGSTELGTTEELPGFGPDHPRLAGPERSAILEYLAAGVPLILTAERGADLVSPARGRVVPLSLRTDGRWVWSDAIAYYLDEYGLAPDGGLSAAIRAGDHRMPEVSAAALHRALAAIFPPPATPDS